MSWDEAVRRFVSILVGGWFFYSVYQMARDAREAAANKTKSSKTLSQKTRDLFLNNMRVSPGLVIRDLLGILFLAFIIGGPSIIEFAKHLLFAYDFCSHDPEWMRKIFCG
jgi:hypothetical protein